VGERRRVKTAFGQELAVELLMRQPPHAPSLSIDDLEDSLLALDFDTVRGKTFLYANLSTFCAPESTMEALRRDWNARVERIFPSPVSFEPRDRRGAIIPRLSVGSPARRGGQRRDACRPRS
jgi:hypothetical protein